MYKQEIILDAGKVAEIMKNVDLSTFLPDGGMALKNGTVTLPRAVTVPLANIEAYGVDSDYVFSLEIFDHYFTFEFNKAELKKLNRAFMRQQPMITFIWLEVLEPVTSFTGEQYAPVKVMFKV